MDIEELKDVFELATSASSFVKEMLAIKSNCKTKTSDKNEAKIKSSGYYARIGSSGDSAQIGSSGDSAQIGSSGNSARISSSGDYAQIGSSGDYARIGSSGDSAQIGSSGDYAQIGSSGNSARISSSGDYAQIGSSGDYARIGSSGYYAQIGSSGYSARIGSSGYSARIGSSGDSARIGSSGDSAQIGSSGDSAQIGSSGDYAQIESSGNNSIVASIGFRDIVKAKKGSWITLAEYKKDENGIWVPDFVKTKQVDGERIKEDVFYTLYNREFQEVEIIDNVKTIVLSKKKNVWKTRILNDDKESFIFTKDGINAHGKTVKQAYRDWLFKTSPRDMSEYEGLKLTDVKDLNYWVVCYRTITGACSLGTENYLEQFKALLKPQMTLQEVIEATNGQYGAQTFRKFFGEVGINEK